MKGAELNKELIMVSNSDFRAFAKLDLDAIKIKIMHPESGEGWTAEYADSVECEYRRFLYLMKKFPNEASAPLVDVDTFWHYHILDTMKYASDCEEVFGYFLHHFPYLGLRGDDDKQAHHRAGEKMKEMYEQTFGDGYPGLPAGAFCAARPATAFCAAPAGTAFCAAQAASAFCAAQTIGVFRSPPCGRVLRRSLRSVLRRR